MEFKSKQDLEIPLNDVFDMLSDFDRHERLAMRRGVDIARKDSPRQAGLGTAWDISFLFRGKQRHLDLEVTNFDAPQGLGLQAIMQGLESAISVELVALSRTKTRMNVVAEMKPKTLSARLLVQSFKLARGNINKRFNKRLAAQARDMEARYTQMA
nr:SRPBCC family protein [uncultured Shimia sp.]